MSDEDQERFEDYLALENYIEALQAGKVAHPPANLTPDQVRVYQMAALFNAATDENAEPRPEFVEQLKAKLLASNEQSAVPQDVSARRTSEQPLSAEEAEPPVVNRRSAKPARFFSRRGLLTGGAAAAASLVIGAGVGYEVQKEQQNRVPVTPPPVTYPQSASQQLQVTKGIPTRWLFVTTLAELGNNAVRFTSDAIVGHVIRTTSSDDWNNNAVSIKAFSATCTHMGCLVQWKNTDRQFHCPCHGAAFSEQGTQVANSYPYKLSPLVQLNTKVEDGKVYVEIPL